jgi:hypothetical protein
MLVTMPRMTVPSNAPHSGLLSRRGLLAAGAGGAVLVPLAGCSVNNPFSDEETPAPEAVRDLSPDVAVAVEAVTAIRAVRDLVQASTRRHPQLVAPLQGLLDMHAAHLDALVDAVPDRVDTSGSAEPPAVPGRRPVARKRVLARERALQQQLVGFALRAQSGPFARLLGATSASVSQHLAVLEQATSPEGAAS